MTKKERLEIILSILGEEFPNVKIQLDHSNPFELLVATILSAQCTDARVNIVTKPLFQKYKLPTDYLLVEQEELEQDIYSTGFYKSKAKSIKGACKSILNDFGGQVPGNMRDLLTLPGVGRKTANVLLGHSFNTPGIVVDTHVIRISNRLKLVDTRDPAKIEYSLMKQIPKDKWVIFTHYLINLGRGDCNARKPLCLQCKLRDYCPSKGLNESK